MMTPDFLRYRKLFLLFLILSIYMFSGEIDTKAHT